MKTILFTLIVALLSMAASCDKKSDGGFNLGESFELKHGERNDCTCGALAATFTSVVEDSRCPSDVTCVWAGRIIVTLEIELDGAPQTVTLSSENNENQVTVGAYLVTMNEVTPYPVSTTTIQPQDYKVNLTITQL
ncbi:MAG: hypothetical protein KF852_03925 [Saprospiraceae bacterium]|nr:hypothetical protein [Saprospiraceae bacterium]